MKKAILLGLCCALFFLVGTTMGAYVEDEANTSDDYIVFASGTEQICFGLTAQDTKMKELGGDTQRKMYVPCCPSCSDLLHYSIRHPMFAVVTIALLTFPGVGVDFYICNDIDLGTDEKAEQYYEAIITVHKNIGFTEDEYPKPGLTLAQLKVIMCNGTEEEAQACLEEDDWGIGRLYYYYLVATYHRWLHPEDAHYTQAQMKDEDFVGTFEIDPRAYDYATIAFFHDQGTITDHLLFKPIKGDTTRAPTLPTSELDMVKDLIPAF